MPNMSYCRFHNTLSDLRDCEQALQQVDNLSELSDEEAQAAKHLIALARDIGEQYGHLERSDG